MLPSQNSSGFRIRGTAAFDAIFGSSSLHPFLMEQGCRFFSTVGSADLGLRTGSEWAQVQREAGVDAFVSGVRFVTLRQMRHAQADV